VQKEVMTKAWKEEQQMVEKEKQEVEQLREEDCEVSRRTEGVTEEQMNTEELLSTEGEGNEHAGEAEMEGPRWEGNDGEELGDISLANTFFYQDNEHESVEEEGVSIAGWVTARQAVGGCQVVRTPPSKGGADGDMPKARPQAVM
jgi:hypothetical protein